MSDPTTLLPQPVLQFLNIFVVVCHYLNHFLGYGWGYMALVLILALSWIMPGLNRWQYLRTHGMSNDEAIAATTWIFLSGFILTLFIGGYVYYHGGNVAHPV